MMIIEIEIYIYIVIIWFGFSVTLLILGGLGKFCFGKSMLCNVCILNFFGNQDLDESCFASLLSNYIYTVLL